MPCPSTYLIFHHWDPNLPPRYAHLELNSAHIPSVELESRPQPARARVGPPPRASTIQRQVEWVQQGLHRASPHSRSSSGCCSRACIRRMRAWGARSCDLYRVGRRVGSQCWRGRVQLVLGRQRVRLHIFGVLFKLSTAMETHSYSEFAHWLTDVTNPVLAIPRCSNPFVNTGPVSLS